MANERKKVIAYVTNEASCIKSSNLIKKTHQQTFQYQIAFQMIMNMFQHLETNYNQQNFGLFPLEKEEEILKLFPSSN